MLLPNELQLITLPVGVSQVPSPAACDAFAITQDLGHLGNGEHQRFLQL
jgi:hypothetical protein